MSALLTSTARTVTVPGSVDLAVHDSTGDADGPPVVLLHGLASTHRWWGLVAARLAGRRVVRFDHRGHGQSSTPPDGYTIGAFADDTVAVLDALDTGRCLVAGHSFGAAVAMEVAARRPDLVAGLCLVDGGIYDPRILFGDNWWDARYRMLLDRRIAPTPAMLTAWATGRGLPAAAIPALLANYQPDPAAGHPADKDLAEPTDPGTGPVRLRLAVEHEVHAARSLWSHEPAAVLATLRAPTVAVLARPGDPASAALHLRALLATFDQAGRTVPVQWLDGGHDLPLEHPDQVAAAIAGLAGTDAQARGTR